MMSIVGILLLVMVLTNSISTNQATIPKCEENQFSLRFSSPSTLLSSPAKTLSPLRAFTVCFWMNTKVLSRDMIVFSYRTTNGHYISLTLNTTHVVVAIGNDKRTLKPQEYQLTLSLLSICLIWRISDSDGQCKLYINSALVAKVTDLSKDFRIQSGGTLYLGGRPGGPLSERFDGDISHFNMWSYGLSTQVIAVLGQRCSAERGDVISWDLFKDGTAKVQVVQDICPNQVQRWNREGLAHHWSLNGDSEEVNLVYSAVYLEGRYTNTKSLFLDSTRAHAVIKPSINLLDNFTIAFWMKYTSDDPRNATILNNFNKVHKEFILKITDKEFVFQRARAHAGGIRMKDIVFTAVIDKWVWQHVALVWHQTATTCQTHLYVDGLAHTSSPMSNPSDWVLADKATSWDLGGTYDAWDYGYFLGYLGELIVFTRALDAREIASLMAVGAPSSKSAWNPVFPSAANPAPMQTSVETWSDIGSCINERHYKPADCLGALLVGLNYVNFTYDGSTIPLPCDQTANGGGWLVIGTRFNTPSYFDRTIKNYTEGFWKDEKTFWLGSNIISSMTKQATQLLIEIQNAQWHGRSKYVSCFVFKMDVTKTTTVVHTDTCARHWQAVNAVFTSLDDIRRSFVNSSFTKVEMKIRPVKDLPTDYTLFLQPSRSLNDNIRVRNLTKSTSFTICLWVKVRQHHQGTLFSLVSKSSIWSVSIKAEYGVQKVEASCPGKSVIADFNVFDDQWHHVCVTWDGAISHVTLFINGKKLSEHTANTLRVLNHGGVLSIGRYQDSRLDSSVQIPKDFIGQLGHVNMWNVAQNESIIAILSDGPGSESGNVVNWAVVRTWLSGSRIKVLYPSTCLLRENYRWSFKAFNNSVQLDDRQNHSAYIEGGTIASDETLVITSNGSITAADDTIPHLGLSMSFWIKQQVLISSILGDNFNYHSHLRAWLSPLISHHATWVRCYSSRQHGWFVSKFHSLCDFKGPTLTLIRVKDFVFGGMIDQSWGGSSGFLPSKTAFLFTLRNPHNIAPKMFPIKKEFIPTAAHNHQFVGPSFGSNDLVVYEDANGRVTCWSSLGTSYDLQSDVSVAAGRSDIFAGSRWFYPDEIEVFFYDIPIAPVHGNVSTSASLVTTGSFYCSLSPSFKGDYLLLELNKLETVTHIALRDDSNKGYVTAFRVSYNIAKHSKFAKWNNLTAEFVSRAGGHETMHALLPPITAYKVQITPTKWHKQLCVGITLYTVKKACGQPFGMDYNNKRITDRQITASSSFWTNRYESSSAEYRWPHRGRLNYNSGSKAWQPAASLWPWDWFQVDLGKTSDVRCIALQGRSDRIKFVQEFKFAYSVDGAKWDFSETNYKRTDFKGLTDSLLESTTVLPRAVTARFLRLYPTQCSKDCSLRTEFYGKQSDPNISNEVLQLLVHQGSNTMVYSTRTNTWKIENEPQLTQWTHVTITFSPTNGIKVFYNGSMKAASSVQAYTDISNHPAKVAITMAGGVGTTPMKVANLKLWQRELEYKSILRDYETITCDFEKDTCLDRFRLTSHMGVSWTKVPHCLSSNNIGPCVDDSLTEYCLALKSSPVFLGKSSHFITPLLQSPMSCVSFTFRIFGNNTGRLNVYLIDFDGRRSLLWRRGGNHGKTWHDGSIPITQTHPFKVEFEGILGSDVESYISIDNISISIYSCTLKPGNSVTKTPVVKTEIFNHVPEYMKNLKGILSTESLQKASWAPCYRSRNHGWNASTFEKLCKSKGPTLILARKRNTVFGGYTEENWGQVYSDSDSFSLEFDSQPAFALLKLQQEVSSFSVSLWMQTSSKSRMTLFSANDQFYIEYDSSSSNGKLNVSLFSLELSVTEQLHDSSWHHIFVQWENAAGNCSVFIDGVFKKQATLIAGKTLLVGSSVTLGKRPSNANYFKGKLDRVNMWSNEIGEGIGKLLSQGCQSYHGNVLTWLQFKEATQGNVKVVASTCSKNKSDADYELHFTSTPGASGYVVQRSTWTSPLTQFTMSWWMKIHGYEDLHILSYMVTGLCSHAINLNFGFSWNQTSAHWMFLIGFHEKCSSNKILGERLQISTPINDAYWHHVVVTWSSTDKFLMLNIDGLLEGSIKFANSNEDIDNIPTGGNIILAQTPQNNNFTGDLNSKFIFLGKLTDFNLWDNAMTQDAVTLLALTCGSVRGNLVSWETARDHLRGKVEIYSPSSCPKGNYRPDSNAFLFVLNTTANTSTIAKVKNNHIEVATRDVVSRGVVFGESPHDLIVGVNGNMSTAAYHRNISYESIDQLSSGNFTVDDIEVHYRKESLCDKECHYHHMCDEINGGCKCTTVDTSFGLCDLEKRYDKATHFWPLDHPNDIKNLKGRYWGVVTGKITSVPGVNGGGLKINGGPQSEIILEKFNTSCLDEPNSCQVSISLWLKYWLIKSEQNQTFLNIDDLMTLYQPNGTSTQLAARIHRKKDTTFTNIFESPAGIWSYYTIVINMLEGLIYRNGKLVQKIQTHTESFPIPSESPLQQNGLITLSRGGALAEYDDLVLSADMLEPSDIKDLFLHYTDKTIIPVTFSARLPQETWHSDLTQPDSAVHLDLVNRIKSNITSFYGRQSRSIYGIKIHAFRQESVVANFTISYYPWTSHLVSSLLTKISSTSTISKLAVQDVHVEPDLVPKAPLNVEAFKQKETVYVRWTLPAMNAVTLSYFQGYIVYYQKHGEKNATKTVIEGYKNEATLAKLVPFSLLRIWVAAFSIKGEGLPSKEFFLTNSTLPTVTPRVTAAYNLSSSSIFITWERVNMSGRAGYELVIHRNDSRENPLYSALTSCENETFKGLEIFTAYAIQVAVFSKAGRGPYSDPVVCMTDEEAPSGSPSHLTVVRTNSTQLELSWQPIPLSQRNGVIQGYFIIYYLLDENNQSVSTSNTLASSTLVKLVDLKPYSSYLVEIAGYTNKGKGPFQNVSYVVQTEQAAPAAFPVLDTPTSPSSTSILVKWQKIPKADLNGILQYYIVHYQAVKSPLPQYKKVPITNEIERRKRRAISNPEVILSGLKKYTLYYIKIAGVTVAQGPYSPVVNVSTDEDIPGPPMNLKAINTSSTSIRVTWQPPSNPNGLITSYKVFYLEYGKSSHLTLLDVTTTSATIHGLVNYTTYVIRVAAFTIKGMGNESITTCTTDEEVPTGPPEAVSALPATATSIEVKWQPVPLIQRRGIITHYEIVFYNSTSVMILQRRVPGNKYSIIIDGLERRSNYSVKVRAETRKGPGPFSNIVHTNTHSEVPKSSPANVTATLNGITSILVKWSVLSQRGIRRYIICYSGINHPFAGERNTTVEHWTSQVVLKDLFYHTRYSIRVAAYSTQKGNYSQPVYVTTGEAAPTKPPSMGVVSSRGSTSIAVFWEEIPDGYRNGKVIEYQVEYRKSGSIGSYETKKTEQFSLILVRLYKNTDYDIKISGATSAGYGNSSHHFVSTDEDVPSETPQHLTAHNKTSLTALPVTWQPVPAAHMHGQLTGYLFTYSAVKRGDRDVLHYVIHEVTFPSNVTSYTITSLHPLSVYRISVAALTKKGAGPLATTFGETCRCTKTLTTSWRQYIPYANITNDIPGLIIPVLVDGMTSYCCGYCKEWYGYSKVDFAHDGNGSSAEKTSLEQLLLNIDGDTDFTFPVYGYQDQTTYKGGLGYTPLITSPGVAFIVNKQDNVEYRRNMFNTIVGCWPVLAIPIVMCYIAGFIIWVLDTTVNPKHYPRSFVKGIQDGVWWSFVSMTTVGYGDRTPRGHASRGFAVFWTLCGIVIISVCTSTLTTSLTEVTIQREQKLYGAQVAAIQNSPEFFMGKRKNAHVNEKKQYHSLQDLIKALHDKQVDGILVDTYAAGSRADLFNHPSLTIAKVLDYKMAYGLVTAGYAIQMRRCFQDYLNVFKVDIFNNITHNVRQIESKPDPPDKIISDGLFNTKAEQFRESIKYTGSALFVLIIAGVCFEWIRRLRARAPIESQEALKDLLNKKEAMTEMVIEFKHKMNTISQELITKHKMELSRLLHLKRTKRVDSFVQGQDFAMKRLSPNDDYI